MDCFKIDKTRNLFRIFNALPDNIAIDVYIDGKLTVSNLQYKDFTPYSYGDMQNYKIDIYKAGTKSNPILRTTIKLPAEQIFTLAITGNIGEEAIFIIEDDITQKPSNTSSINRIINLSPDLQDVDVNFNGTPSADNITYRDQTLYAYLPPGEYTIEVQDSETDNTIVDGRFEFKVNRIYTIYIIGNVSKVELLQSVDGNTYACL